MNLKNPSGLKVLVTSTYEEKREAKEGKKEENSWNGRCMRKKRGRKREKEGKGETASGHYDRHDLSKSRHGKDK